ncbi:alpha/beta fold hydrolase [Frankia sp. AgPm24]|uniref:thioesterase II family protein n=1 Tax=Frankia sp. AgPm24 TaxID=631128 RepID=UPI00200C030D|nr:alpha/beta fold hydrolase [Frankia sp. AgPm24]MCK9920722.1 alpha/beta fold hydrolase [Frankia sp. AgPm24]
MTSRWWRRPRPRPEADLRLVCFGHAGGGATFYRWLAELDGDVEGGVEVVLAQYPGRENRVLENMPATMAALVDEVVPLLPPGPLALFGHSMGALVAYEVARRLAQPADLRALIVSGRPAPGWQVSHTLHQRSDAELVELVRDLGGTDAAVLDHPELRARMVAVMRADLRLVEGAAPVVDGALTAPVHAMAGLADRAAPPEQMIGWAGVTRGAFALTTFPGGHFYLVDQAAQVRAGILAALRTEAAA